MGYDGTGIYDAGANTFYLENDPGVVNNIFSPPGVTSGSGLVPLAGHWASVVVCNGSQSSATPCNTPTNTRTPKPTHTPTATPTLEFTSCPWGGTPGLNASGLLYTCTYTYNRDQAFNYAIQYAQHANP